MNFNQYVANVVDDELARCQGVLLARSADLLIWWTRTPSAEMPPKTIALSFWVWDATDGHRTAAFPVVDLIEVKGEDDLARVLRNVVREAVHAITTLLSQRAENALAGK